MLIYLIIINIIAFIVYGIDKWKAKRNRWRISEKMLLFLAIIGGSVGALAGMYIFHHKTLHKKFVLGVPLILLIQVMIFYSLTARRLRPLRWEMNCVRYQLGRVP